MAEKLSKDFYDHELRCPGSGILRLHPGFLDELQLLRDDVFTRTSKGMIITSGGRSAKYNALIGGHPKSLHVMDEPQHEGQLGLLAVDVAMPDGIYRGVVFSLAWARGWSVGWNGAKKFLHIDKRILIGLPQTTFDY